MKIISSGCDPRATLGGIIDLPFLGSAAVGASPLESADPGGRPASGEDRVTLFRQDLAEETLRRRSC